MKDITNQRKRKNSFIIFYFLKLMVKKKKKFQKPIYLIWRCMLKEAGARKSPATVPNSPSTRAGHIVIFLSTLRVATSL